MAATKYTKSIQSDFPNHRVNSDDLASELRASAIVTALDNIETAGDVCDLWFKDELSSGDEIILDAVVAAHQGEVRPDLKISYAQGIGAFVPDPSGSYPDGAANQETPLAVDADGALLTRGQVLTDEKSLRDDFSGTELDAGWSVTPFGQGTSHAVASSLLTMSSGTTPGSLLSIYREGDWPPFIASFVAKVSQRIANQIISLGFSNSPDTPINRVSIIFDGTDNTKLKFSTQCSDSEVEETTCIMPFGLTTSSFIQYQLEVCAGYCALCVEGTILAKHETHIPLCYTSLKPGMFIMNTGVPTSSTDLIVDVIHFENNNQVQISDSFVGEPFPMRINEEVHSIIGKLVTTTTTANQVIVEYTVPAGKSFFLLGFLLSASGTAIDAAPFKIRKNSIVTEPDPPGAIDCNIFRSMFMNTGKTDSIAQDYSACPRKFAIGGDVVQATVTPSGTTSTTWRVSLDFVLR